MPLIRAIPKRCQRRSTERRCKSSHAHLDGRHKIPQGLCFRRRNQRDLRPEIECIGKSRRHLVVLCRALIDCDSPGARTEQFFAPGPRSSTQTRGTCPHFPRAPMPERSIRIPALFGSTGSASSASTLPPFILSLPAPDLSSSTPGSGSGSFTSPGSAARNTAVPSKYPVCHAMIASSKPAEGPRFR